EGASRRLQAARRIPVPGCPAENRRGQDRQARDPCALRRARAGAGARRTLMRKMLWCGALVLAALRGGPAVAQELPPQVGLNMPTGAYERNAPVSLGTNAWAFSGKLGVHANLWSGGFVEAEGGLRHYARNEEPEFGGLAPHKQGADRFWDASVTQKVWRELF